MDTIHSSPPIHHQSKTKGFSKLKGTNDYSSEVQHDTRVNYVKSRAPIGTHKAKATWLWQEAQEKLDFALSTLTQQTQGLTTDCHAGNPCDPKERSNGSKSLPND
ncbi:hypothetical protein Tco_0276761 [Tanacetum coccineum]